MRHVCLALLALALPLGTASAQPKPLIEVAAHWQVLVIPALDRQVEGIKYFKSQPKYDELAAALAGAHASTRNLTIRIHAFVLDRTEANEAAVIAAMLEFCGAAKRVSSMLDPFAADFRQGQYTFSTRALAHYLRNEVEHDGVRKAC